MSFLEFVSVLIIVWFIVWFIGGFVTILVSASIDGLSPHRRQAYKTARAYSTSQHERGWPEWVHAKSIDELGGHVIDWLEGRALATPWQVGNPYSRARKIHDVLVAINQLGGVATSHAEAGQLGVGKTGRTFVRGVATRAGSDLLHHQAQEAGLVYRERLLAYGLTATAYREQPVVSRTWGPLGGYAYREAPPLFEELQVSDKFPDPIDKGLGEVVSFLVYDPKWGRSNRFPAVFPLRTSAHTSAA